MADPFTFVDGERLIRFGAGVRAEAPALLAERGFEGHTLLTTERAAATLPALADAAREVLVVPPGRVDDISAELLTAAGDGPLVALGGGRVVDTAKAIAGARGSACAAIPTTLSGAELTPFHRTPTGVEGARMVRPSLVIADSELMASQPPEQLAASAMNALAHAMEALYTPRANPVAELSALRGAELLAAGVRAGAGGRDDVALGALLAGYASASTGIAIHHATCQTIVRSAGEPARPDERGDASPLRRPHGEGGARPARRLRARPGRARGRPFGGGRARGRAVGALGPYAAFRAWRGGRAIAGDRRSGRAAPALREHALAALRGRAAGAASSGALAERPRPRAAGAGAPG